jgi:hypothetical protein
LSKVKSEAFEHPLAASPSIVLDSAGNIVLNNTVSNGSSNFATESYVSTQIGSSTVATLSDVSGASPSVGDALVWDGTQWAPSQAGPSFSTASTRTINLDLSADSIIYRLENDGGATTFTGSNYTAGKSATVKLETTGAGSSNLTFPAGWVFISFKPTTLGEGKVAVLSVTSFGSAESDVVAAWSEEV